MLKINKQTNKGSINKGSARKHSSELEEIISLYSERAQQLDKVLDSLTKDYCATQCPNHPIGCCYSDFYNQGLSHETAELLEFIYEQEAYLKKSNDKNKTESENSYNTNEDKNNNDTNKAHHNHNRNGKCKYHTLRGCVLETKSPACIGFLCQDLEDYLLIKYRREREVEPFALEFINSMRRIHSLSLSKKDYPLLFFYMEKAIMNGRNLVSQRKAESLY